MVTIFFGFAEKHLVPLDSYVFASCVRKSFGPLGSYLFWGLRFFGALYRFRKFLGP